MYSRSSRHAGAPCAHALSATPDYGMVQLRRVSCHRSAHGESKHDAQAVAIRPSTGVRQGLQTLCEVLRLERTATAGFAMRRLLVAFAAVARGAVLAAGTSMAL